MVSSAAEAEIGGLFINVKAAIPIRQTLIEMGHPQPPTPMQTDNSTAHALITNKIRPKALKSMMEMRFNFLKCRQAQEQFRFYWAPGISMRRNKKVPNWDVFKETSISTKVRVSVDLYGLGDHGLGAGLVVRGAAVMKSSKTGH